MPYHTKQSHNLKKAHCRITSCQLPDVHSLVVFSGVTGDNTPLRWGASPGTKALCAKQSYHLQCRYNAENRRSDLPGFLVNAINDLSFQRFFKIQAVPSSVIQKMRNRCSVFLAKEFGIDDFPPISEHKDRAGQGLYMFQIDIG